MLKTLGKVLAVATVLSSLAFTNLGNCKFEIVQDGWGNGLTAHVDSCNWDHVSITAVQFEVKIGGFSFGTSNVFVKPYGNSDVLSWTDPLAGRTHYIIPNYQLTWQQYTADPAATLSYISV